MENSDKKIERIVVTGGTAERRHAVQEAAKEYLARGYAIFMIPNSMEELERAGVTPEVLSSPEAFVSTCLDLQLAQEYIFTRAASLADTDRILILSDGGVMDCAALLSTEKWHKLAAQLGVSETVLRDNTDAVFFVGSPAAEEGMRMLDAWAGHPHLRIIEAKSPEAARDRLIAEIGAAIGDPEPVEIEKRYLIERPDTAWLEAQPGCRSVQIEQAYLEIPGRGPIRLRKRGGKDGYIYFETVKRGQGARRTEIERRITEQEYDSLLSQAGSDVRWIQKTRYCFIYNGQYLEIDVYPFWGDKAIAEVELLDENEPVDLPPEIHVIREVTGDPDYSNYALARPRAD